MSPSDSALPPAELDAIRKRLEASDGYDYFHERACEDIRALLASDAALRKALREIVDAGKGFQGDRLAYVRDLARTALAGEGHRGGTSE